MQYCPKCKVHIRGDKRCCPLCQGSVRGNPQDPAFPVMKKRKYSIVLLFKVCLFLFVLTEVAMLMIDMMTGFRFHLPSLIMTWAPFVLVDLLVAIYYRGNVIKILSCQAYVVMAVCFFIDLHDGRLTWSIRWVIPSTLLGLVLATILIGYLAGLHLKDYLIYLVIDMVLTLLQLIPVVMGINDVPYMAIATAGVMIVIAAFVVIFKPKDLSNAFSKYMNLN